MNYFVMEGRASDPDVENFPTMELCFVIDENGYVIAGPCSLKEANEIADYMNSLSDYKEARIALIYFIKGKSLEEVRSRILTHRQNMVQEIAGPGLA